MIFQIEKKLWGFHFESAYQISHLYSMEFSIFNRDEKQKATKSFADGLIKRYFQLKPKKKANSKLVVRILLNFTQRACIAWEGTETTESILCISSY